VRLGVAGTLVVGGFLGTAVHAHAATETANVLRIDLDQAVQPLSATYVVDGIKRAERGHAAAVLLRIDTPGGLNSSMRSIIKAILNSKVPVVCWTGPQGARAASAGTFIMYACHYTTMAPGTNIGAAHPVGVSGAIMSTKVTNDAAAFIRSLAQERGRNADWAERAVRQSVAVSAEEALRLHVIDAIADSPDAALREANGHVVGGVTLSTWPARVTKDPIALGPGLIGSLIDPNLAFVLFLVGLVGLVFEFMHPGLSVPGGVGLIALVLSGVMFDMLPVRLAGVILLLGGVAFLIAELHIGHGFAAIAGVIALTAGGLLLFDAGTLVRVSIPLLVGVVIVKAAFILIVLRAVLRARRMPPPIPRTLICEEGVAKTDLDPVGLVNVRAEDWTAESDGRTIKAGSKVRVRAEQGLRLKVEKLK
jgi:membrane-bound serine protease (ClpP class)